MSASLQSPEQAADWLRQHVAGSIHTDSRRVGPGDGFIAWPGAAIDGREFVPDALQAGALACLVEEQACASFGFNDPRVAVYKGLKAASGPIAAAYFNEPSRDVQVIAVTGTNGKTSTAWWLAEALGKLGRRCGLIGTLGTGEPGAMVFNGLTTPDPVLLQQQLRRFADQGVAACALEASSIGIAEKRLDATRIRVAVFTNFTQDHLDYHGSMKSYWEAKTSLFDWPGLQAAVVNVDDPMGAGLADRLTMQGLDVWTISTIVPARLQAQGIAQQSGKLSFCVCEGAEQHAVAVNTAGLYNVSNLLGVIAAMRAIGLPLDAATNACNGLASVPGRLDVLARDGLPMVVIDYAHTPDALEKVLLALKPAAQGRQGRLWCIFGCGGNRDAVKRPLMAAVAQTNADQVVVTSDNPRLEDPAVIIDQILGGLVKGRAVHIQADRALAIVQTIARADARDVVLVAGKGHEDYQDIGGVKHPFSDRLHAEAALDARLAAVHAEGGAA